MARARAATPQPASISAHERLHAPLDPSAPFSFPRRVLLCATGLSPQIVTETLYALAVRPPGEQERFLPTEIYLVTTANGAREARLNLLADGKGWFYRLVKDYDLPTIAFDDERIRVLTAAHGRSLEDIWSPEENELAADFITDIVREITSDLRAALHASIAGGRKTMGYYLGYALSLYGRPQDRLSHVLVSEPFENNREFFYPTPYVHRIRVDRGGRETTYDAREARVELAQIPFVRLREGLTERLRRGQARFSQVVAAANRAMEEPRLVLALRDRLVLMDDERIDLGLTDFTVLLWLAQWAREQNARVDWSVPESADEFLKVAKVVLEGTMRGEYQRIENALEWRREVAIKLTRYFEPHKSRINKAIENTLGVVAASRYSIQRAREGERTLYYLPLMARQIEIRR
jgi:CRISPR-associated protein (TIGR02584 family)